LTAIGCQSLGIYTVVLLLLLSLSVETTVSPRAKPTRPRGVAEHGQRRIVRRVPLRPPPPERSARARESVGGGGGGFRSGGGSAWRRACQFAARRSGRAESPRFSSASASTGSSRAPALERCQVEPKNASWPVHSCGGVQLKNVEVCPTSGPTWHLSHSGSLVAFYLRRWMAAE
jgi:hypothetical protein